MPTAKFLADFAPFEAALERAETKVREFGTEPQKVERALSRMTDAFSGRRLIEEATLAAEAVQRIERQGGLTGEELRKVATLADQAAQKLRAMGQDVPERLATLAARLEPVHQKLTLTQRAAAAVQNTFAQVTAGFGVATLIDRGVTSLFNFGRQAVAAAGEIKDLAEANDLTVESAQRMQAVAKETGTEFKALSDAAFTVSTRLGEGGAGVRGAVQDLGLDFANLRRQNPEQILRAITGELASVGDVNERNRLGVALFGKNFKNIAGDVVNDYARIADAAKVSSDGQIAALDAAAKRWEKFKSDVGVSIRSMLGTVLQAGDEFAKLSSSDKFGLLFQVLGGSPVGGAIAGLAVQSEGRTAQAAIAAQQAAAAAAGARAASDYTAQLAKAIEATSKLTAEQRRQIAAGLELGKSTADLADEYGVTTQAIEKVVASLRLQDELMGRPAVEKARDLLAALEQLRQQGIQPQRDAWAGIVSTLETAQSAMETTGRVAEGLYERIEAARRRFVGLTPEGLIPSTHLGVGLSQAPSIGPQPLDLQTMIQDAAAESERLLAERIAQENDLASAVGETAEAHRQAGEAAAESANEGVRGYEQLKLAVLQASSALKVMVPEGFSWTQAFKDAGFFVNDAGSFRPLPHRDRSFSNLAPIVINAQGSFLDSPESLERLADRVGNALSRRTRGAV